MHRLTDDTGGLANPLANPSLTRVSIGIIIAMGFVSFMGMLPRFTPFFVLTIASFFPPFPKPWVLITSTFYCSSIFSGIASVLALMVLGRVIEPVIGSREFLRVFVMIGFYTNLLTFFFAISMYLLTGEPLLLVRPFETGNAPMMALSMLMAQMLMDAKIPTACGTLKLRLMPFIMFCVSLLFSLLSPADGLLSSLFGGVLSYVYIRYIRKVGGVRGDPSFTIDKLLPAFSSTDDESSGGGDGPHGPAMEPEMMMPPMDEHHNFRLDSEAPPRQHTQHGRQAAQFQGRARTLGD